MNYCVFHFLLNKETIFHNTSYLTMFKLVVTGWFISKFVCRLIIFNIDLFFLILLLLFASLHRNPDFFDHWIKFGSDLIKYEPNILIVKSLTFFPNFPRILHTLWTNNKDTEKSPKTSQPTFTSSLKSSNHTKKENA